MATGVCVWWMMFHIRMSHVGQVCSGDYLSSSDSTNGYLIDSGDFIIFFLYLIKVTLTILACYGYWFVFTHDNLGRAFDRRATREAQEGFAILTVILILVLWWIYSLPSLIGPISFLAVIFYIVLFKATGFVPNIRAFSFGRDFNHGQGATSGWEQRIRNRHSHV